MMNTHEKADRPAAGTEPDLIPDGYFRCAYGLRIRYNKGPVDKNEIWEKNNVFDPHSWLV